MGFNIDKSALDWNRIDLNKSEQNKLDIILDGLRTTTDPSPMNYILSLGYEVKKIHGVGDNALFQVDIGSYNRMFFEFHRAANEVVVTHIGHT